MSIIDVSQRDTNIQSGPARAPQNIREQQDSPLRTNYGCSICNSEHRTDIEAAILAGQTVQKVSGHYGVSVHALENHVANCAVYLMSLDEFDRQVAEELKNMGEEELAEKLERPGSLQRQLNLREADILANTMREYMVTLKNMGRMINSFITGATPDNIDGQIAAARTLKKPIMDAYVLIGSEIRQTAKTMNDLAKDDSDIAMALLKPVVFLGEAQLED